MSDKPLNVITRSDLTTYAFAVISDAEKVRALASVFAPTVPIGTTSGRYNVFSDLNSFKSYAELSRRAVGGQANQIRFLSDTDNFNAEPYGLRISIDQFERTQAGNQTTLLEQAKTRTLTISCLNSHLASVITAAKAAVSAASGKGSWGNADVDPIVELDSQIEAIWKASGMLPNHIVFDFGAWIKLKNNPNVKKYMPGADAVIITPERVGSLLINPNMQLHVTDVSLYANRTDEVANTKKGALAGSVFIFYSSQAPTQYDPSFMKTFSPSGNLFTEVFSYEEQPHLTWFENDWTADIKVVGSKMARRIDVA